MEFWHTGRVLEHKRRYSKTSLSKLAEDCGFNVIELIELNRIGTLAWFLNGRVMRSRAFGLFQIWALNVLRHCFVWPTPLYHCLL